MSVSSRPKHHFVAAPVLFIAALGTLSLRLSEQDASSTLNPDAIESPCELRGPNSLGDPLSVTVMPDEEATFRDLVNTEVEAFRSAETFTSYTIPRFAKESVPATLTFEWEDLRCSVRGKVSLSGDWGDHLGVIEN